MADQLSVTIEMKNYTGDMVSSHIAQKWDDVAA
jgi:hypothetical protein